MKKILSLILVMIAVALPVIAQDSSSHSSTRRVSIEVSQTKGTTTPVHRAPMRINIEAYYNEQNGVLDICYDGEAIGETFLYLNNTIIGYDSEINTSFQILTPGLYKIEVIGETWIAQGYIQIEY
ncbi:MAG: hypothetical protein K2H60_14145 [Muribaculaceae bacterium]|nr:hypothetical protein [Muribaculaceae bacterium]